MKAGLIAVALATGLVAGGAAAAQDFAVVDGKAISAAEYDAALRNTVRQKFYHREVPEAKLDEFRREVAENLVDRVLLLEEVRKRGLAADPGRVAAQIAEYDKRYGASEQWKAQRDTVLPSLTRHLEERDALDQLTKSVRAVGSPDEMQLSKYYETHKEQFTQPEQARLSIILLKVDPSAPGAAWQAANEEAAAIRKRILAGSNFGELAKLHSTDPSAAKGGDLGYQHKGSIPEPLFEHLDKMKPGDVSEPLRLLEGIAVFRLEDRKPATLHPLSKVRERAVQLWQRTESDRRWNDFIAALRAAATIRIDTTRYPALVGLFAATPGAPRAQ